MGQPISATACKLVAPFAKGMEGRGIELASAIAISHLLSNLVSIHAYVEHAHYLVYVLELDYIHLSLTYCQMSLLFSLLHFVLRFTFLGGRYQSYQDFLSYRTHKLPE